MPLTLGDGEYTIEVAAKRAGSTPARIRIWEHRYGWPTLRRHPSGYRIFTEYDVQQIARVERLLKLRNAYGRPLYAIGDILADGMPRWPAGSDAQPRIAPDFGRLRLHVEVHSRAGADEARYLRLISGAIIGRAGGILGALLMEVSCLVHPSRRAAIAWTPVLLGLAAWDAAARSLPDADALRQFIRDQIGSDGLAALLEQIANPETTP